jgi:hypothetical protein
VSGVLLEIVILTYENGGCLEAMLDSIEHDSRVRVTVLDNSDKTSCIQDACVRRGTVRYVKNKYNIGTGTILRAFEIAESEYVWVVGCCNSFLAGGIKTVCDILEQDRPVALLHWENDLYRNPKTVSKAAYKDWELFLLEHSYSVACSLNSIVWKVDAASRLLPVGYDALTSMCPHAAMLFAGMKEGTLELAFYPVRVFNRHARKRQWSMRQHIKWVQCIFPYTDRLSQACRDKLIAIMHFTDGWVFDLRNED